MNGLTTGCNGRRFAPPLNRSVRRKRVERKLSYVDTISENDKLEYQEAMKLYALDSGLRRQGLTFIATAQAVLVAVVFKYTMDDPILVIILAIFAIVCAPTWSE